MSQTNFFYKYIGRVVVNSAKDKCQRHAILTLIVKKREGVSVWGEIEIEIKKDRADRHAHHEKEEERKIRQRFSGVIVRQTPDQAAIVVSIRSDVKDGAFTELQVTNESKTVQFISAGSSSGETIIGTLNAVLVDDEKEKPSKKKNKKKDKKHHHSHTHHSRSRSPCSKSHSRSRSRSHSRSPSRNDKGSDDGGRSENSSSDSDDSDQQHGKHRRSKKKKEQKDKEKRKYKKCDESTIVSEAVRAAQEEIVIVHPPSTRSSTKKPNACACGFAEGNRARCACAATKSLVDVAGVAPAAASAQKQ